jgi:glycosyltransferase involved in cell wall biosynthesis
VQNDRWFDPWRPDRSTRGVRFKFHYLLWLRQVERRVEQLVAVQQIDIIHQVGLMTISAPPKLWRLSAPFIWGPIGGGEVAPLAFRRYYGKHWNRERTRRWRIWLIGRSLALRNTVRHAAYVLAINRETRALLQQAGADPQRLALMIDAGSRPDRLRLQPRGVRSRSELVLLWAGMLEARKGLPLLLEALSRLPQHPMPVRVQVAGDGPMRAEWQAYAEVLGLSDCVEFLGTVPPVRMANLYEDADAFVFTSLQDAFGTVVMEAMTHALPVIVLNHQGCAAVLPEEAAIKIPVSTPNETVAALAAAIDNFRRQPDCLAELSQQSLAAARAGAWPERVRVMTELYEKCLTAVASSRLHNLSTTDDNALSA